MWAVTELKSMQSERSKRSKFVFTFLNSSHTQECWSIIKIFLLRRISLIWTWQGRIVIDLYCDVNICFCRIFGRQWEVGNRFRNVQAHGRQQERGRDRMLRVYGKSTQLHFRPPPTLRTCYVFVLTIIKLVVLPICNALILASISINMSVLAIVYKILQPI